MMFKHYAFVLEKWLPCKSCKTPEYYPNFEDLTDHINKDHDVNKPKEVPNPKDFIVIEEVTIEDSGRGINQLIDQLIKIKQL
jgi:hypothetical protein